MHQNSPLTDLLHRARRRRLAHLTLDQTAIALSAAMVGMVLLLVVGTQILDWYWPLVLFVGGLALGVYRLRSRIPSSYGLLQAIDRRLHFYDAMSTAHYFAAEGSSQGVTDEVQAAQREGAEQMSRSVDLRQAVPFGLPKSFYAAALLIAAASTMFAIRYAVRQSLDLRPPIAESLFEFYRPTTEATMRQPEQLPPPEYEPATAVEADRRDATPDAESEAALSMEEPPDADASTLSQDSRDTPPGDDFSPGPEGGNEGDEPGDARESSSQPEGSNASGDAPDADAKQDPSDKQPPAFPPNEDSDLIKKMQDAFANLLSKLKIPPRAGEGQRLAQKQSDQGNQTQKKKGRQMPGSEQGEGEPTSDPRGKQTREGGEQAKAGQGKAGNQASSRPGQQQARSGMGTKEGGKDVKMAQQLEAMGKLSEIIGRRAENVTGEVMVEVNSGNQRLRTEYSDSAASHSAAGGEIHRDEVPLELRHYVQKYFEEVRKPN